MVEFASKMTELVSRDETDLLMRNVEAHKQDHLRDKPDWHVCVPVCVMSGVYTYMVCGPAYY